MLYTWMLLLFLTLSESVESTSTKGTLTPKAKKSKNEEEMQKYVDNLKVGDIFENDIVLDKRLIRLIKGSVKRGAILNPSNFNRRWPDVTDSKGMRFVRVPYKLRQGFFSGLSKKSLQEFQKAIERFHEMTCVRFVPKKSDDRNFIEVYPGEGCWSQVGRRRGKQMVSLGKGCGYRGHIMHELMHVLGFLHEQSRMDRDDHVMVHFDNINPARKINFEKYHQETGSLNYDFKSLLHYTNKDSSENGGATIQAKNDPDMVLGRKNDFSPLDIVRINMLYNCPQLSNDLIDYKITVKTSNTYTAGTDADVQIEMVGKNGNSGENHLLTGGATDDFERGSVKDFVFVAPYVGQIKALKLRLATNSRGWFNGWKPTKFIIEDPRTHEKITFNYSKWIYPGTHELLKPTSVEPGV